MGPQDATGVKDLLLFSSQQVDSFVLFLIGLFCLSDPKPVPFLFLMSHVRLSRTSQLSVSLNQKIELLWGKPTRHLDKPTHAIYINAYLHGYTW